MTSTMQEFGVFAAAYDTLIDLLAVATFLNRLEPEMVHRALGSAGIESMVSLTMPVACGQPVDGRSAASRSCRDAERARTILRSSPE